MKSLTTIFLITLLLLVLGACNGGGSGSGSNPPPDMQSGDWDQLIWDQEDWS